MILVFKPLKTNKRVVYSMTMTIKISERNAKRASSENLVIAV